MSGLDGLPAPSELTRPFDRRVAELLSHVPESVLVRYATSLLAGDDPAAHPVALRYMGGAHADLVLESRDFGLWPAVWGARALLYAWTPEESRDAAGQVVEHLADERWRVAEMCTKVVHHHELAEGADRLLRLVEHPLARVRMHAVRALGRVGEREHLPSIVDALDDEDEQVRRSAHRALELRAAALDLDPDDVIAGLR